MAFTDWDAVITAIKNQIATWADGDISTAEYEVSGFRWKARTVDDLFAALDRAKRAKDADSGPTTTRRVMYGKGVSR